MKPRYNALAAILAGLAVSACESVGEIVIPKDANCQDLFALHLVAREEARRPPLAPPLRGAAANLERIKSAMLTRGCIDDGTPPVAPAGMQPETLEPHALVRDAQWRAELEKVILDELRRMREQEALSN